MKIKNILLSSVICLLTVALCVVGLTACDGDESCAHQWGEWTVTTDATCAQAGAQKRECSECGETETATIDTLAHDWNEATCSAPKTCKNCSATEGSALAHVYTVDAVKDEALKSAATCTSAAVYYRSCSCGVISTQDADTFTSGSALEHEDSDNDHICDNDCGTDDMGTHADADKDHGCDYNCDVVIGTCEDANKDHACDYGCAKTFGTCEDANKDHACDYGCAKTFGACEDANKDHACDYGCAKTFGACEDANKDHACDYGCTKLLGEHSDSATDNDHVCDYGCGAVIENCFDKENDSDHNCDLCGKSNVTAHNYSEAVCGVPPTCSECGATTGVALEHKDENFDHICDNNCGKNDMGTHADSDTDNDHVCDYGCKAVFSNCSDVDTDNDHNCDICSKPDVTSHIHAENAELATEATCKAAATKTYECNCGDKYTEVCGDVRGHNITGAKAEERHVSGCEYVLVYVCQYGDCDDEVLGETVHKHNYIASIKTPATCKSPGEKTFKCKACGDTSKAAEPIPADATGHDWKIGNAVDGIRTDTCSICKAEKTVTVYTGIKTDEVKAEDLADKEIEVNNANISLDSGVIDTIGDQKVTVSADKVEGIDRESLLTEDQLIQVGNSPIYNFTINNGDKNISDFGKDNYATITLPYTLADGEDVDSIAVWFINDKGELESIKATYNNGHVTFKTNHFSYYTVTRLTPAERCALYGHGYAEQVVEGSCTQDGYVLLVCVRCHDKQIKEGTFKKADGHDYASETHDATCTENGYVVYVCNDCGHSYTTKISATGHAWTLEAQEETSCAADGYTKYGCDNCDEEYIITYAKLAHVYTHTVVPATCAANGYTLHDCDNCDYSYTDAYVEALGHVYGDGVWTWEANFNKAKLTLVCGRDGDHAVEFNVISDMEKSVEKGECSEYVIRTHTATVEYNGVTYTDVKIIRQGNPQHKFPSEWTKDENEHWHECVCGEKNDIAEHTFGDAKVTKDPTCAEPGESTAYCSVCGEAKVTEIPATGEHNYVDGVCSVCKKEDISCNHTKLSKKYIDMGDIGACDWILFYYSCECGEVKILDENSDIECDLDEVYENDQYVDDNGNTVMTMKGACHCGLEIIASAIVTVDGCTETYAFDYVFKFKGETVIEIGFDETETWHKNKVRETIDLSKYGACGGSLTVYKCNDCGEIIDIYDILPNCNIDLDKAPETEQITDEKGVIHYVQKVECPDCDLEVSVDIWNEKLSVCEYIAHMTTAIRYGDTTIVEIHDSDHEDTHEVEYSYELMGDTCRDGVKVHERCSICGTEYSYTSSVHVINIESDEKIDLSEHTTCGGTITVDRCTVCGYVTNMRDSDINCDMDNDVEEEIIDSEGNVIGERCFSICSKCGLKFVEAEWIEYFNACEYEEYEGAYIYKGEECIFKYEESQKYLRHKYEYTYENESNDCNERYKVIAHCTVCGANDEWWSSGHREEEFVMNLSDHNGCTGTISGERCAICGYIMSLRDANMGCDIKYDAEPDEIVGEDGIIRYVKTATCPDCGLRFVSETWSVEESACIKRGHQVTRIYSGNNCIFEYESEFQGGSHQYEYEYELDGETCDDGYYVIEHCTVCGASDRYHSYGHQHDSREIDLAELGLCGGWVEERYCSVCNTILNVYGYSSHCNWEFIEQNAEGYNVYKCSDCGATKLSYTNITEKDDNCERQYDETVIFVVNGEEVYSYKRTSWTSSHRYQYDYIMNGTSCLDGYTLITTCKDCDMHQEETSNSHAMLEIFDLTTVEGLDSVCTDHYVGVYCCPCGQKFEFYFDRGSFRYDEKRDMHICDECDIAVYYDVTSSEDGCSSIVQINAVVYYGDKVLYDNSREEIRESHTFTNVNTSMVNGVINVTRSCEKCQKTIGTEILSVEIKQHGDGYYYDYTFTPGESSIYTISGLSDKDTYVVLYKMLGNQMIEIDSDDDGNGNLQFLLTANLTAGTTYVYRISFCGQDEEGTVNFALAQGSKQENVCKHNMGRSFTVLLEGSQTCEDGVLYGTICVECGCMMRASTEYEHITAYKTIDLAEFGACYGELYDESCACGKESEVYLSNSCYDKYTTNKYYDEEGRLIQVVTRTCSECGLRYDHTYYTVENEETCTSKTYNTFTLTIKGVLIAEGEYVEERESHKGTETATLIGGDGSSCEDGVMVTLVCERCGHKESDTYFWHYKFQKEVIDLANVCGGYAVRYTCACGKIEELQLDNCLCELGTELCELWIEDAISGRQAGIDGWNYFGYSSYIDTCAVTDPVESACGYKIRYARYWLKDEDSCIAYQYETWQFGYDEKTGTYDREVTFKTGERRVYHNYVDGSKDNHTKYDCPDCGSYYYENYYPDGNNVISDKVVLNNVGDGYEVYTERLEETCVAYTGPFGDYGYKSNSSYTNSKGESYSQENAYVIYKGYDFVIYSYRTEGDYWYKYDYTYTFGDGCIRTEKYVDSTGDIRENTEDYCRSYHYITVQNPTCTQDGIECRECVICGKRTEQYTIAPHDHNWVWVAENWYYCSECGLENANGVSGDIIMEDLTDQYGNGEYYVVGYYARNEVKFSKFVSLVLPDGTIVDVLSGIEFITVDGVRAYKFSKAEVDAWANARGYTDYDVRFTFVPDGSDGSFDYGLTFAAPTVNSDTISNNVSFVDYIGSNQTKSYVITPTESGVWTFISFAEGDTYATLCNEKGDVLVADDSGANFYDNFKITYDLKAGETYILNVSWWYDKDAGNVPLLFGTAPVME